MHGSHKEIKTNLCVFLAAFVIPAVIFSVCLLHSSVVCHLLFSYMKFIRHRVYAYKEGAGRGGWEFVLDVSLIRTPHRVLAVKLCPIQT